MKINEEFREKVHLLVPFRKDDFINISSFDSRRVLYKEGHPPHAYYILISGSVLVNVREVNKTTGKEFALTVQEKHTGESFGVSCQILLATDVESKMTLTRALI